MESPVCDLELLRLVQRTGPVIQDLAPDTINRLMTAFHQLLCEGTAVPRILPWLWQLSEPKNGNGPQQVPDGMKEKLVEVVRRLSHQAPDDQVGLRTVIVRGTFSSVLHELHLAVGGPHIVFEVTCFLCHMCCE